MRRLHLFFSAMTLEKRAFLSATHLRISLVCATLAGFVLALALAASPELHERLHHAGDHEDGEHHECLATVLHAGGCDDPTPAPLGGFFADLVEIRPIDKSLRAESFFLCFGILEHAPPRRA